MRHPVALLLVGMVLGIVMTLLVGLNRPVYRALGPKDSAWELVGQGWEPALECKAPNGGDWCVRRHRLSFP